MNPIITWVGSKRWIYKYIKNEIKNIRTYYEPFAGSASLLFKLQPERAVISDTILPLINMYQQIKLNPYKVHDALKKYSERSENEEALYEANRSIFNSMLSRGQLIADLAALFIYLNKTGFNGLWRQNTEGEMNVPYGHHKYVKLPTLPDFIEYNKILQNVDIIHLHENKRVLNIIRQSKSNDLIFADPPYYQTFTGYDGNTLPEKEFHQLIAIELWRASIRGSRVIATNIYCEDTRRWYESFCDIQIIERHQNIAANSEDREKWKQLIAINRIV